MDKSQGQAGPPPPYTAGPGYYPPTNPPPMATATTVTIQPGTRVYTTTAPAVHPGTTIVLTGNCPNCRMGMLEDSFGCFAIFLAIFFFPLGILCCLLMKERRCSHCGGMF